MKTNLLRCLVITLAPAALLALTSCSSTPEGKVTTTTITEEGVPGGVAIQTYQATATVTAIDALSRKVTLASPDGKMTTVTCGPEVVNFNQIHVGDQVKVKVAAELVAYMAKDGPSGRDSQAALVGRAQPGSKPGAIMAEAAQVTATISALDLKGRKVTLLFPDGSTRTYPARKDVDLTQRQIGEEVVIRYAEARAITVEKP